MTETVLSDHNYIEYQKGGATNLIITIPHGGDLRPVAIPPRDAGANKNGNIVYAHEEDLVKDRNEYPVRYKKDTFTHELGVMLADKMGVLTGVRPHVVLCHLYRGKLDVNCAFEKATFRVPEAERAWYSWHDFITQAKTQVESQGRRGLMLDIHGHTHPENWVELGYTLSTEQLNTNNFSLSDASIRGLINANNLNKSEAIQGPASLGTILSNHGYKTVPSMQYPCPGESKYYSGGFNTVKHGSHSGGAIDAIQLEIPNFLRNAKDGPDFVQILADSILDFLKMYYN